MAELKPCPFCGAIPVLQEIGNDFTKRRKVIVKCPRCRIQRTDAALAHSMFWLRQVATENWNMREKEDKE